MDAQRLPAPHPRREGEEVGKVRVVIDMEMGEENIVDRLQRHRHRDDVAHAAGAEIKEEPLAVTQFDHDAGAGLRARDRDRRTADEGDPHFVGADLLLTRVIDVVADEIGRRPVIRRKRDSAARHAAVRVLCLGDPLLRVGSACRRRSHGGHAGGDHAKGFHGVAPLQTRCVVACVVLVHDAGSFATVVSIRPAVLPLALQACWKARMRSPNSDATNADSVVMEPM